MSSHWLLQLAVLAIVVFWVVGAYNRLMRLRNAVASAWAQVEPAQEARLGPALAAWIDAEPRIGFARQTFNEAVQVYNHALHQWPTRLITAVFGFAGAGRA